MEEVLFCAFVRECKQTERLLSRHTGVEVQCEVVSSIVKEVEFFLKWYLA